MLPECSLEFFKKFGIRHEVDYQFRGYRRTNPSPRNLVFPCIYISHYRILRDFEDPVKPLTERVTYHALHYGDPMIDPMMGSMCVTPEFEGYKGGIIR